MIFKVKLKLHRIKDVVFITKHYESLHSVANIWKMARMF